MARHRRRIPADGNGPSGGGGGGSAAAATGTLPAITNPLERADLQWHVKSITVRAFKSFGGEQYACFELPSRAPMVGIVGSNGAGKSTLLQAICFAAGCSPGIIQGCRTLRDITSTTAGSALPEVRLEICRCSADGCKEVHQLHTTLTPDGGRVFRVDGRIMRSATQLRVRLHLSLWCMASILAHRPG